MKKKGNRVNCLRLNQIMFFYCYTYLKHNNIIICNILIRKPIPVSPYSCRGVDEDYAPFKSSVGESISLSFPPSRGHHHIGSCASSSNSKVSHYTSLVLLLLLHLSYHNQESFLSDQYIIQDNLILEYAA